MELLGEWNGMPIFAGGQEAQGPCGCTWIKAGYKKISTYLKDVLHEAQFRCCTKKKCQDENCTTETKYKDFAKLSKVVEDELSLIGFETTVTTGFYLHNGKCGCGDPNIY